MGHTQVALDLAWRSGARSKRGPGTDRYWRLAGDTASLTLSYPSPAPDLVLKALSALLHSDLTTTFWQVLLCPAPREDPEAFTSSLQWDGHSPTVG